MIWPFSRPKLTVLVVCTANVCRSPAAEALLRHHLRAAGLAHAVAVKSTGTDVAAPGRRPDPRVLSVLDEMGVRSGGMRAKASTEPRIDAADVIFVMEERHRQALCDRFPGAATRVELLDPSGRDIPDPYYGNKAGVRSAVEHIAEVTLSRAQAFAAELD